MRLRTLVFGLIILFHAASFAAIVSTGPGYGWQANKSTTTILFVNGINNDIPAASASSDALMDSLYKHGLPRDKYNYTYHFVVNNGFVKDNNELLLQFRIANNIVGGLPIERGVFYKSLGDYYNTKASKLTAVDQRDNPVLYRVVTGAAQLKERLVALSLYSTGIIVVPHSQGNFYIEAAYAMLVADGRFEVVNKIRVVGVASVAATTPSNRYISNNSDLALAAQTVQTALLISTLDDGSKFLYVPLEGNATPCYQVKDLLCDTDVIRVPWGVIDSTGHGFREVYLNEKLMTPSGVSFPSLIYGMILSTLGELPPPPGDSVAVGEWSGWTGSKYEASDIKTVGDFITKNIANWAPIRVRLATPINGDSFSVEFMAANSPEYGGEGGFDLGWLIGNEAAIDKLDASGWPIRTRWVGYTARTYGWSDVFYAITSGGNYVNYTGSTFTPTWHTYGAMVAGGVVTYTVDGAVEFSQAYTGTVGPLDTFSAFGRSNIQLKPGSLKIVSH